MTPKEKAIELVYKYQYLVTTWDCYNDESLEIVYRLPDMKQCALIAVDEILDASLLYFEDLDAYVNYWQEVKQEIEKL
jgi:diphthamide synthase subunit DPH2